MKRINILWTISIILVLVFFVKTGLDYRTYTTTLNSAPFWVWIAMNGIYFLLPSLILAAAAWVKGRKNDV